MKDIIDHKFEKDHDEYYTLRPFIPYVQYLFLKKNNK